MVSNDTDTSSDAVRNGPTVTEVNGSKNALTFEALPCASKCVNDKKLVVYCELGKRLFNS